MRLHFDGEPVANRIFDRVKSLPNFGLALEPKVDSGRWLGRVEGRAVRLYRVGPSIVVTWGDRVMEASLEVADHPDRSARAVFSDLLVNLSTSFLAATWPGRFLGLIPAETSLSLAVAEAPPVVWSGVWGDQDLFRVEGSWSRLDGLFKAFLDRIPLNPPPDH